MPHTDKKDIQKILQESALQEASCLAHLNIDLEKVLNLAANNLKSEIEELEKKKENIYKELSEVNKGLEQIKTSKISIKDSTLHIGDVSYKDSKHIIINDSTVTIN